MSTWNPLSQLAVNFDGGSCYFKKFLLTFISSSVSSPLRIPSLNVTSLFISRWCRLPDLKHIEVVNGKLVLHNQVTILVSNARIVSLSTRAPSGFTWSICPIHCAPPTLAMPIAGGRGDRQSRHHHSTDMANLTNTFAIPARHRVNRHRRMSGRIFAEFIAREDFLVIRRFIRPLGTWGNWSQKCGTTCDNAGSTHEIRIRSSIPKIWSHAPRLSSGK